MRVRTVLLATLALLLVGGVAVASIPDASGVIHGCRKTSNGDLTVIDSATQTCPAGTVALNWSQTGPQGPAGGLAGYEVVTQSVSIDAGNGTASGNLAPTCPVGKVVMGGGWNYSNDSPPISVNQSYPDPANRWWRVIWRVDGNFPAFTLTAYATCAQNS